MRRRVGDACRVEALVDDVPIWFESADVELEPSPEAFGCALLVASLDTGRRIRLADPVDARWRANCAALLAIFREWWGYDPLLPEAQERPCRRPRAARSALCFSAGADSFFSLLHGAERADALVSVHGFDIRVDDARRWAGLERSLAEVAAVVGTDAITIRTNLRLHPVAGGEIWERSHGGALAAIGHLLSAAIGRLFVSSSVSSDWLEPWGSHYLTDHLWSSDRIEIVHVGADRRRWEKLMEIAAEPLVQRHLRVCWEYRTEALNCSRCDKCLRTMIRLQDAGQLERYRQFEPGSLVERLDAIEATAGGPHDFGAMLERPGLSPELLRAVRDLLARTDRWRRRQARLRRLRSLPLAWRLFA